MEAIKADQILDLKGVVCPINFVKTKLKLEEMEKGQVLEVYLDDGEPILNVPRSVKDDGHKVLKLVDMGGWYRLFIEKS